LAISVVVAADRDGCQGGRNGEQVLDAVAHLARVHLADFLSLLALGHVEEDAQRHATTDRFVVAMAAGGYPLYPFRFQHDAEIDFVETYHRPRRLESATHPVQIVWMYTLG
jgi:hypothetical protein